MIVEDADGMILWVSSKLWFFFFFFVIFFSDQFIYFIVSLSFFELIFHYN